MQAYWKTISHLLILVSRLNWTANVRPNVVSRRTADHIASVAHHKRLVADEHFSQPIENQGEEVRLHFGLGDSDPGPCYTDHADMFHSSGFQLQATEAVLPTSTTARRNRKIPCGFYGIADLDQLEQ